MKSIDWFVGILALLAFGLFFWNIAVPLWRAMREESLDLPPAGGPGYLGVEGPRRRS